MSESKAQNDPLCSGCGEDDYLLHLDGYPFCQKCFNKWERDKGLRRHETQEWHDKLDRVIAGTESYNTHGTREQE